LSNSSQNDGSVFESGTTFLISSGVKQTNNQTTNQTNRQANKQTNKQTFLMGGLQTAGKFFTTIPCCFAV
jgi:hypothetical protein